MVTDIADAVTTTPEYHALFAAFETSQADWDRVRPRAEARDAVPDEEPTASSRRQCDLYRRYRHAVDELNAYRLRHGLGTL